MTQHCVTLWLEGDTDPKDHDWEKAANEFGFTVEQTKIKTYPWSDVHHEVTWWITRSMTLDEWIALDDAESEVLSKIVGDDFMGTAGPIPV